MMANGNIVDALPSMTYAWVVSRYIVHTHVILSALNDCEILCTDIQNAHLNTKTN